MLKSIEKQTVSRGDYVICCVVGFRLEKTPPTCIAEEIALHQWQYSSFHSVHSLSSPPNSLVWVLTEFLRLKSDNIEDWVVF